MPTLWSAVEDERAYTSASEWLTMRDLGRLATLLASPMCVTWLPDTTDDLPWP